MKADPLTPSELAERRTRWITLMDKPWYADLEGAPVAPFVPQNDAEVAAAGRQDVPRLLATIDHEKEKVRTIGGVVADLARRLRSARRRIKRRGAVLSRFDQELARLRAIVDKLPKTADGAVVVPDGVYWDPLWAPHLPVESYRAEMAAYSEEIDPVDIDWARCHSTRAAAEAARD